MSQTHSDDIGMDAADDLLSGGLGAGRPATDDYGLRLSDDGVAYDHKRCSRWQKYGHDRIYFNDGSDGYVDLETGAVEDDTIITNVEVEDGRVVYYATDIDNDYPVISREL